MESIDIPKALGTLRDNYLKMESLGQQIEHLQNQALLSEAELMDSETKARQDYFTSEKPCKGYEMRDWIKLRTAEPALKFSQITRKLQILKDQLRIIVECNNNVKMSFKILELDKSIKYEN